VFLDPQHAYTRALFAAAPGRRRLEPTVPPLRAAEVATASEG
jgi:hypothetical protein